MLENTEGTTKNDNPDVILSDYTEINNLLKARTLT
jgi:hypothetical protein